MASETNSPPPATLTRRAGAGVMVILWSMANCWSKNVFVLHVSARATAGTPKRDISKEMVDSLVVHV
jgi:hypothetical protein